MMDEINEHGHISINAITKDGENKPAINFEKKIIVLTGGCEAGRYMSLKMGDEAVVALRELGYKNVRLIDVKDFRNDFLPELWSETTAPDVVYSAMQGGFSVYGAMSGFLDCLQIPYTHSGVRAHAIEVDKILTKIVVAAAGVPVIDSYEFDRLDVDLERLRDHPIIRDGAYVLKPVTGGASIDVHLFQMGEIPSKELLQSSDWRFGEKVMVERFIPGREFTCAVLNGKFLGACEVLQSESAIFDKLYDNLDYDWHDNLVHSGFSPKLISDLEKYSLAAHNALGCRNLSRSDFRVTPEGEAMFLELNAQPGMVKDLSLYPPIAEKNGISYNELIQRILEDATCDSL
ncbi:D-alanine--D-alanine ligase [Ditylenchus destructor]|nr:D-alanine--D-alanine ligase [Ditylenchus destructor]